MHTRSIVFTGSIVLTGSIVFTEHGVDKRSIASGKYKKYFHKYTLILTK
jgi:hypothetical protein